MPQKFLSIKNFEKYQHFKKANPPWVKLYRSLFTDREFIRLPTVCKYLYIGLVTLASEGCNRVPNDLQFISHRLAMNPSEIDLKPLYKSGFLIASESTIYRETISQRRDREETETETEKSALSEFEVFWEYYPRKVGKKDAHRAWEKAKDRPLLQDILSALAAQKSSEQWTKDHGQFIPHPATWLNQGRWADQLPQKRKSLMEEFIERGQHANGSRAILQGLADAHFAAVGQDVSGSWERDDRTTDDSPDPARAVL